MNEDGSLEMRTDAVARDKPDTDGTPGKLNVRKTKARARDMINNGTGNPLPPSKERKKRPEEENAKGLRRQLRLLQEMQEFGDAIHMNLLEKSGLADDRVLRDLNLLEDSINEASHHLNTDELRPALDRHFGERALRHIAAEAERIAETYADMGADHAGPLFNRVMGNQASDGAYFTKPTAASIAARLTLDACGDADWSEAQVWRDHKIVDLACGSGTLLAAMLTDMKRRAEQRGGQQGPTRRAPEAGSTATRLPERPWPRTRVTSRQTRSTRPTPQEPLQLLLRVC